MTLLVQIYIRIGDCKPGTGEAEPVSKPGYGQPVWIPIHSQSAAFTLRIGTEHF